MIEHFSQLVNEFNQYDGTRLANNELRGKLLLEEVQEFINAETDIDRQDAILDILYVAFGAITENRWRGMTRKFYEVHRSNMSKMEDGQFIRNEDGKIIKGKDYYKPNLDSPKYLKDNECIGILDSCYELMNEGKLVILDALKLKYVHYLSEMLDLDEFQINDLELELGKLESDLGL